MERLGVELFGELDDLRFGHRDGPQPPWFTDRDILVVPGHTPTTTATDYRGRGGETQAIEVDAEYVFEQMSFQAPPVVLFGVALVVGTLTVFAIGARIFLPEIGLTGIGRQFIEEDWKYLGIAWIVTQGVNQLSKYHIDLQFTDLIYAIEGERVALFQAWTHEWLTLLATGVYFVGFPFIVLFTYFVVKAHDPERARRYVVAYLFTVLLALPFFIFFPVGVSAARADVAPLIYDVHPIITVGTLSTDTLLKAFPSLHTGLSVLAAIYAHRVDTTYGWTATILAVLVVFSTFYGGIHWISDAVVAVVLALIADRFARRIEDPKRIGTRLKRRVFPGSNAR